MKGTLRTLYLFDRVQLVKVGVTAALLLVATRLSRSGPLTPLRVYLWAAGGAFVTWRIASTTLRRLVWPLGPELDAPGLVKDTAA